MNETRFNWTIGGRLAN